MTACCTLPLHTANCTLQCLNIYAQSYYMWTGLVRQPSRPRERTALRATFRYCPASHYWYGTVHLSPRPGTSFTLNLTCWKAIADSQGGGQATDGGPGLQQLGEDKLALLLSFTRTAPATATGKQIGGRGRRWKWEDGKREVANRKREVGKKREGWNRNRQVERERWEVGNTSREMGKGKWKVGNRKLKKGSGK